MKAEVLVRFTVEHTASEVASEALVQGACEVGTEEAPVENYNATDVSFDLLSTPTMEYALELVGGFTDAERDDFYGRLENAARSIAESIMENRA